jgi:exopolysaccharide biosynthesis polyprenyl glycosylphosphotransferase
MAPYITSPERTELDLRSPTYARLRRGIAVGWLRVLSLILLDASLLALAWYVASVYAGQLNVPLETTEYLRTLLPIVVIEIGILAARGLYKPGDKRRDFLGLVKALSLGQIVLLLTPFPNTFEEAASRLNFPLFWLFSILFTFVGRSCTDLLLEFVRSRGVARYPVFLISDKGDREQAVDLIEQERRYDIIGVMDARALDRAKRDATFAKLRRMGVTEAFVSWDAIKNRLFLCWHFQTAGITLHVLPIGIEPLFKGSNFWMIGGCPVPTFPSAVITGLDFWVKRIFDFCSALLLLMTASPIYVAIALLIKLDSSGPIFYKQTRIGLHGKPFKVWKFRTMVTNADKLQKQLEALNETKDGVLFKIKDDPRVTRVGKVLRRYSLDELPQIFNVLFGEMSLVGPRPLPLRDVENFSQQHFIRQEVLPGITGLWQVSGRSDIDNFEDVVRLDLTYIENWSLWLDLKILLQTVRVVFQKTGAY